MLEHPQRIITRKTGHRSVLGPKNYLFDAAQGERDVVVVLLSCLYLDLIARIEVIFKPFVDGRRQHHPRLIIWY